MRLKLATLFIFLAQPSAAACHHFTIWRYHFPQHCGVGKQRWVQVLPQLPDKSWFVEITKLPEDIEREDGIDKLKEKMKK